MNTGVMNGSAIGAGVGAASAEADPVPAVVWLVPNGDGGDDLGCGVINKNPGDVRHFAFDFGNLGELVGGDLVESATLVVSPVGPSVGAVTVTGGYLVGAMFSGGTAGTDYTVTCTATLSGGGTAKPSGVLRVR